MDTDMEEHILMSKTINSCSQGNLKVETIRKWVKVNNRQYSKQKSNCIIRVRKCQKSLSLAKHHWDTILYRSVGRI